MELRDFRSSSIAYFVSSHVIKLMAITPALQDFEAVRRLIGVRTCLKRVPRKNIESAPQYLHACYCCRYNRTVQSKMPSYFIPCVSAIL